MTNLRRFNKATIHASDQPGPPSPYVGERSHTAKMPSGISKFLVGNAQTQCAFYASNHKVNPIGGDGPIDVNWMGGKDNAEPPRPRCRMDRHSDFDYWRRSTPVCHTILAPMMKTWNSDTSFGRNKLRFPCCTPIIQDIDVLCPQISRT